MATRATGARRTAKKTTSAPKSEEPKARLYHYRALVTEVHDGDTCTVDIDLGLSMWVHGERVRLHRINAPELKGDERPLGEKAREALKALVLGKQVVLQTLKDEREKYGRYLGEIWLEQDGKKPLNVNDALVRAKHAKYRQY